MDWSKLPDLAAVILLACAFASVARRSQTHVSTWWLTGWVMIALHFAASIIAPGARQFEATANFIGMSALTWAGILFMWASVPSRKTHSSRWMLAALLGTNTLYIGIVSMSPTPHWALNLAAALFGVLPLTIALVNVRRKQNHPLRWTTALIYCALSGFLLVFQNRPENGLDLGLNAVLFTVYFGCCTHFWFAFRHAKSGAFVTIAGFFAWSMVFVVAPSMSAFLPNLHIESEAWNLPKYVVAVGMILLLLEQQIEHNHYLALHDELTGLPNRRLFQDRLASALERARRTGSQAALLLIDLDQFKHVNDTQGHHAGDQVLRRVATVFSSRVRRSDTVARTGGDEFSVILDQPINREDAELVGQSLIELINEPFELDKRTVRIGASVGIAVYPEDASDAEGLCIAADRRMYDAKYASGRPGYQPRSPMPERLPAMDMQADSRQAG